MSYVKLIADYNNFGLKLVDIEAKNIAIKSSWPFRWVDKETNVQWIYSTLPIKDSRIWEANLEATDVDRIIKKYLSSSPVASIWKSWCKITMSYPEDAQEILNMPIWANSHIRCANVPFLQNVILQSNIDKIIDIWNPYQNRLMNYEETMNQFGHSIPPLLYYSITSAIPNRWKIELRSLQGDLASLPELNRNSDRFPATNTTRFIYWQQVEHISPVRTALQIIWAADLACHPHTIDWESLFPSFLRQVHIAKLRVLQYKILTRTLTTNKTVHIWDSQTPQCCSFCYASPETILHLFTLCPKIKPSWDNLEKWMKRFLKITVSFTPELILFNNYCGPSKIIINNFIIFLKYYIYSQKCKGEDSLRFIDFMTRVTDWFNLEKLHAINTGQYEKFKKKWKAYAEF